MLNNVSPILIWVHEMDDHSNDIRDFLDKIYKEFLHGIKVGILFIPSYFNKQSDPHNIGQIQIKIVTQDRPRKCMHVRKNVRWYKSYIGCVPNVWLDI